MRELTVLMACKDRFEMISMIKMVQLSNEAILSYIYTSIKSTDKEERVGKLWL